MARIEIKFGINPALRRGATAELWGAACRNGLRAAIAAWHGEMLPQHFEASAARKYFGAYTPRTKRYMLRKAREKHHQRPMIWSGGMYDEIVGKAPKLAEYRNPRSTRLRVRIDVHARHMNFWSGTHYVKSSGQVHDFRRELAVFSAADTDKLRQIAERVVAKQINAAFEANAELAGAGSFAKMRKEMMAEIRKSG